MSGTRGRKAMYTGMRPAYPGAANGARGAVGTQAPAKDAFFASARAPRAQGLVGSGIGPYDARQAYPVGGGGGKHPYFDLSNVIAWRLLFAVIAAAYITGFHITLGPVRIGLPRIR